MIATKPCQQCGVAIPAVSKWGPRQFCGMTCRNRALVERKRKFQPCDCPICHRRMSDKRPTCSKACGYQFRKLRLRRPKTCPICKVEFWPVRHAGIWSKHCSLKCRIAAQHQEAFETFSCANCHKQVRRRKLRTRSRKHKFCGRVCAASFFVGEKHLWWRGGGNPNRGAGWVKLAAKIRLRDNYTCQRCGRTQEEDRKTLSVDHIRPWRSFKDKKEANDPSNLTSLCRKCHGYKTMKVEPAWLRGDVLAMKQYEKAVKLPPLLASVP